MRNLAINTAQNVNVDYKLVGLGERMVAFLIDAMILFAYISVVENLFAISEIFNADSWTRIGFLSLFMLPAFCYSLLCHLLFNGRTVGKMIMNIKVVRLDGAPTEWYNLIVRWLLRLIDIWLFFSSIGVLSILLSDKKQRVGDYAAGTVVISTKKQHQISSTILEEINDSYEPVFSKVTDLTDGDVRNIKETYNIARKNNDNETLSLLRNKISTLLNIESGLYDREFIDTVIKDYSYYTQQM